MMIGAIRSGILIGKLKQDLKKQYQKFILTKTFPESLMNPYIARNVLILDDGDKINVGKFETFPGELSKVHNDGTYLMGIRTLKLRDVGTVVLLKWGKEIAWKYEDGSSGIRITCEFRMADVERRLIIYKQNFKGNDPPKTIYHTHYGNITDKRDHSQEMHFGSVPDFKIKQFIKVLPRWNPPSVSIWDHPFALFGAKPGGRHLLSLPVANN